MNVYEERAPGWTNHHCEQAKSQAGRILDEVAEGRELVLLGRRVADAFGIPKAQACLTSFEIEAQGGHVVVHFAPHPSGRNRFWGDERNRQAAAKFLREIVRRVQL